MGDTVETGSDRLRDHTFESRIPPMNTTRPDQINRLQLTR